MAVGPAPVAVAVDGRSDDAVEWAAAEAAARRRPLRIVSVVRPVLVVDPSGAFPPADDPFSARTQGEAVLRAAVDRATSVAPELDVSTQLLVGAPGRRLLDVSGAATLLVVGCPTGAPGLLGRSTAGWLVSHAHCPVVAVRRRPDEPHDSRGPRVVVGVSLPGRCPGVLGLAFAAAAQRDVPLIAVHACGGDAPADLEGVCCPPAVTEGRAQEQLERLLAPWRDRFARVPVRTRVLRADPVTALAQEAAGASLLVLGAGTRGVLRTARLRPVCRSLLRRVGAPMAVQPAPAAQPRPRGTPPSSTGPAHTDPLPGPTTPWD
ncbi:universal stress protein [Modestobacter marinus]|uniref:universal stress protein n=1 Tax=Modestobacter marinus TaxID=477641 RepID=UPI001C948E9C|nr:universal stress protein [Modestobacter marinus]